MTAVRNKDIIRLYFDVVTGKSDQPPLGDFFAPDIEWHVPQSNPQIRPNPRVGHAAVMDLLTGGVGIYQPGSMSVEIERMIADEDHVVVPFILDAKLANGNDYRNRYVFIFALRDGRITHVWEHLDTLYQWQRGTFD